MNRCAGRRSGFTLVEVMLTTVLAAVLLVALWSLLSMYSKTFEGGHARIEQSQLARALFEQITTDVQSVFIAPPAAASKAIAPSAIGAVDVSLASNTLPLAPASSASGLSAPASSPASPNGGLAVRATAGGAPAGSIATASLRPAGIYGTSSFLQLDVLQGAMLPPSAAEGEMSLADPDAPPSAEELRTIVYQFEEFQDPTNPAAVPQTRLVRRELNWAQAHPAQASARGGAAPLNVTTRSDEILPGERMAGPPLTAEPTSSGDALGAPTFDEVLPAHLQTSVPEVLAFDLRYFDGTLWSEEWDSASRGGLPQAIEVSMRLRGAEEPLESEAAAGQLQSGADPAKIAQLKHPMRRLLIPVALARRPAKADGPTMAAPSVDPPAPLKAEAPRGIDLP